MEPSRWKWASGPAFIFLPASSCRIDDFPAPEGPYKHRQNRKYVSLQRNYHNGRDLSRRAGKVDIIEDSLALFGHDEMARSYPRQSQPLDFHMDLLPYDVHITLWMRPLLMRSSLGSMLYATRMPILGERSDSSIV